MDLEEKLVLHIKIHQMYQQNMKVAQIATALKVSRPTVYKYLKMTYEDALHEFDGKACSRKKKLDAYRDWIIAWLEEYPHLSSAQVHDWLLERYPDLSVGSSTVRTYVKEIREIYQIEKKRVVRHYEAIPEQPMGKQIQVDWGETRQRTKDGKMIKLYFIAFVLAHSRMKYVEWRERPFTTKDTIHCHENAFQFYGGRPSEIVYDQDHLIAINENAGDVLLTNEFQAYVNERKFRIHLCRRADPESKGMIENVVKYIKRNFADSRVYRHIEDWNDRSMRWLERTGNHNVHQTTKKRPAEVFSVEKQHLQPVLSLLSFESIRTESIARNVSKDNTIRYRSNRYTVPIGTYSSVKKKVVFLEVTEQERLLIRESPEGEVIADHRVSKESGKLIQSRDHLRDRSKGIEELKQQVLTYFEDREAASDYLGELSKRYPRYRRDQFNIIRDVATMYPNHLTMALEKCSQESLFSANDFRDVVHYLAILADDGCDTKPDTERPKKSGIQVATRPIQAYTDILKGVTAK